MIRSKYNIILFTGNYGSGKTEVAVNYSSWLAKQEVKVKIADLDLVNPYFRCREAREPLEAMGITVVAPQGDYHSADLPILLPELRGLIERPDDVSILDVGGDNVGAVVLASLANAFARKSYEMYFVVNMHRPFTDTVDGVLRIMGEIEQASKLKISALVGNTHLMNESTVEHIIAGAKFTGEVSDASGLPVAFISAEEKFIDGIKSNGCPYPLMPISRMLLPPWAVKKPAGQTSTHSRDGFGKLINSNNKDEKK